MKIVDIKSYVLGTAWRNLTFVFDPFGAGFYELDRVEKNRAIALVEAVRDAIGPDTELLQVAQSSPPDSIGEDQLAH